MYKHKLQFDSQAFEQGMTLPAAASTEAANALRAGSNGSLAITVIAGDGNVGLASGKAITINYTEGETESGPFTAPAVAASVVVTMQAAFNPQKGELVGRLVLPPEVGKFVKPTIATDDAGATGLVDVVLEYLAN